MVDSPDLQGIAFALRVGVGSLLVVAGILKLFDRAGFLNALRGYGFLPPGLNRLAAWAVPAFEVGVGGALLVGVQTREVALVAAGLLVAFTVWLTLALSSGRAIDCGCFSRSAPRKLSWLHVVRNIVLAIAAIFVAFSIPVISVDQYLFRIEDSYSYSALVPGVIIVTVLGGILSIVVSSGWLVKVGKL